MQLWCLAGSWSPYSNNKGISNERNIDCVPSSPTFPLPRAQDECVACQAGYLCNGTEPMLCPPGSYCPSNSPAIPCPTQTYNPIAGATDSTACLPCPAGFLCDQEGMTQYESSPCPAGHFCENAALVPLRCPGGTYRSVQEGKSIEDCLPCPPGFYCPNGTELPYLCPAGYYCDGGKEVAVLCPAGYYADNSTFNRSSLEVACHRCPAGYYCTDVRRLSYRLCSSGYYCTGGTVSATPLDLATEGGAGCPQGYYCPTGSAVPSPCPVGTYGDLTKLQSLSDCLPCAPGSYNNLVGQSACFPCGASSYSLEAATVCICNGSHRAFQPSDGSCLCEPGYQYFDENLQESDTDSTIDCQARVYPRCTAGTARNSLGQCVTLNDTTCAALCPSQRGSFVTTTGLCECEVLHDESYYCNATCRLYETKVPSSLLALPPPPPPHPHSPPPTALHPGSGDLPGRRQRVLTPAHTEPQDSEVTQPPGMRHRHALLLADA